MKFKQNILSLSVYSAVLALMGCGVTSQDNGTGEAGAGAISGVAIDGYVARAVVYVDTNQNNKLDVWETRALTDSRGYFTYSPAYEDKNGNAVAAVNYCELATDHADYTYCLKIPAGYDEVMVRMTQGLDLTTLDPFTGTLSMMVSSNESTIDQVMVGTPITGLLAEMTTEQKTNFYATETDVDVDLAKLDFLDFKTADLMTEADRLVLLRLALKIHKVADSIAGILDANLAQGTDDNLFGIKEGMPTDASIYVYRAMANEITATTGVSAFLEDQTIMERVISNAWIAMKTVVNDYNIKNPSDVYTIPSDPDFTPIATDSLRLAVVVGSVFGTSLTAAGSYTDTDGEVQDYTLADDAKARIRAIDIMASLIRSGADAAAITNAETLASDATYLTNLKSPKTDVTGLKAKFVATGNVGNITAADANYDSRQSFAELFGDSGSVSGLTGAGGGDVNEDGFAGNTLEMGESGDSVGISFVSVDENGDTVTDATSGTMTIDASIADGDFASESGEPLELEGTWEQIDEYTMLMNVEVAGVIEPVIVKPTVTKDDEGNDVAAYYFDLGGEQQIWIP